MLKEKIIPCVDENLEPEMGLKDSASKELSTQNVDEMIGTINERITMLEDTMDALLRVLENAFNDEDEDGDDGDDEDFEDEDEDDEDFDDEDEDFEDEDFDDEDEDFEDEDFDEEEDEE